MIRTSEQINELSDAFAKAQTKFGAAIKASQNPAFRSKYADLASVIDATLEHLNAEGIGVMQHPALEFRGEGEAFVSITTRLQHKTGQWMESDVSLPAVMRDRFDAQSVGSAITYACRYALRSICTVPQADDDANAASGVGSHEAAQGSAKKQLESKLQSADPKIRELAKAGLQKMAGNGQESQQEAHTDARRIVFIKILPNSDVAVNGYLADEPVLQFLTDVAAEKKKARTGGNYYQFAPNYLSGFKELCEKQEIEIA